MKYLTAPILLLLAATGSSVLADSSVDADSLSSLRGRELEVASACVREKWNANMYSWQKPSRVGSRTVVDSEICKARLNVKKRYCIRSPPKQYPNMDYYRFTTWNLQTCEKYASKVQGTCAVPDMTICNERIKKTVWHCIKTVPRKQFAHLQPEEIFVNKKWNLQDAELPHHAKLILDKSVCNEKDSYCVDYNYDKRKNPDYVPNYRRVNWPKTTATSRNYVKITDMQKCIDSEKEMAAKQAALRAAQVLAEKEAKEARIRAREEEKALLDAQKAEKNARRKEILDKRDVERADGLVKNATALEDEAEEAVEALEDEIDDLENPEEGTEPEDEEDDNDEEKKVVLASKKKELKELKSALDSRRRELRWVTRTKALLVKLINREARTKEKQARLAKRKAERQATKRARALARKNKLARNKRRRQRSPMKFPKIEGTCFKDHVCAKVSGDPHITTFDGLRYDCQGHGEFVLVRSLDSQLEIQGRFEDARSNTDGNMITITKAISIDTGVDGVPTLDVVAEEMDDGGCSLNYYLDGKPANFTSEGKDPNAPGIELHDENPGGDNTDLIYFPTVGLTYSVLVRYGNFGCVLNNDICLPPEIAQGERIVGLFGTPNKNKMDDWMDDTGTNLLHENKLDDARGYSYCTQNWCVSEEESIFGYLEDEKWADYNGCDRSYNKNKPSAIIARPTEECTTCCGEIEDMTVRNDCLLECMEGDATDCSNFKQAENSLAQTNQCGHENPDDRTITTTEKPKTTTPDPLTPEDITTPTTFVKGDPHFKTFGGELYDYHGECDLVLLHNPDFKNKLGMDVHIRTKIEDFWSSVESAAIKLGDEILEIRANPESDEWLWINGEEIGSTKEVGKWHQAHLSGFLVRLKSHGENREIKIYLEGMKEPIEMKTFKNFIIVDISWQDSLNYFGSTGLLGSHAEKGARLGRSGTFIEDVNEYGQEWQVREDEPQLFHSYDGAVVAPKKCVLPPSLDEKVSLRQRRLADGMDLEVAEKACSHLQSSAERKACVFDVIATQDTSMASVW